MSKSPAVRGGTAMHADGIEGESPHCLGGAGNGGQAGARRSVWIAALTRETDRLLNKQPGTVFHSMSREFESALIRCALAATGGCRIDAAQLLGIGRNTISRKINEFGLEVIVTPPRRVPQARPRSRRAK